MRQPFGARRRDRAHAWIACEFMIQTMNRADEYRFILRLLLFLLLSVMLQCLLIYYRHFQHI